jgi:hypothetical protein
MPFDGRKMQNYRDGSEDEIFLDKFSAAQDDVFGAPVPGREPMSAFDPKRTCAR